MDTKVKPESSGSTVKVIKGGSSPLPKGYIPLLDKGYVGLVDNMGDELTVANSARVSYHKQSELNYDGSLKDGDARLVQFLLRENHWEPFRHCVLTYEAHMPLFVARQHFKYVVGSTHLSEQHAWSEGSRRYLTDEPTFYIPSIGEWRKKPENSKQGSGDNFSEGMGLYFTKRLENLIDISLREYNEALTMGVAPEQARLFLAAYGMYVRYRWTASLQGVLHFLSQRLEHDAQKEIQDLAKGVLQLTEPLFPLTFEAFLGERE